MEVINVFSFRNLLNFKYEMRRLLKKYYGFCILIVVGINGYLE